MSYINVYFTFFPRSGVKSIVVKLMKFPAVFQEMQCFVQCFQLVSFGGLFSPERDREKTQVKASGREHK